MTDAGLDRRPQPASGGGDRLTGGDQMHGYFGMLTAALIRLAWPVALALLGWACLFGLYMLLTAY